MPATIGDAVRDFERRGPELVEKLRGLVHGRDLRKYISHIRFPLFKNIVKGHRIDFDFPVTAFVGPNGSGKTSALHALYGAPLGKSTSDYWFATDVDPIAEGNGEAHRFIYGHHLEGIEIPIETRKARTSVGSRKRRKPGYFEPTKATKSDSMDMTPFPSSHPIEGQSKDRWNPVDRPLLYMNFRSELSGFDKYLFWGNPKPTVRFPGKHDRLQAGARKLRKVMESGVRSATQRGKRVVFENRALTSNELDCVSAILGKTYTAARLVQHSYYGGSKETSVLFQSASLSYSEAFAGSGELAVVSLVVQLLAVEKYSLVLLDEPEVSLHPGAQARLLVFLMEVCLREKLQIVFTTHSPMLIRGLPPSAIKVFVEQDDGRFFALESCSPLAAFHRVGATMEGQLRVLVEDELAKIVVQTALLTMSEHERRAINVTYVPGGVQTYLTHRIPTLMHDPHPPLLLLDGDAKPTVTVRDPDTIPKADENLLESEVQIAAGSKPILMANSAGAQHLNELRRQYLRFYRDRVRFLPAMCPETIVLTALGIEEALATSAEYKSRLAAETMQRMGADDSQSIVRLAEVELKRKREEMAVFREITQLLRTFLASEVS